LGITTPNDGARGDWDILLHRRP